MPDSEKPKRRRTKKPTPLTLCAHGYPAIPDLRGCTACWTKHPNYVKPTPAPRTAPNMSRYITCAKCFLPSQLGTPPLRRVATDDKTVRYEHVLCPSAGAETSLTRRKRRSLRQALAGSLRRHMRKMLRIGRAGNERAGALRAEAVRLERKLAAHDAEEHERDQAAVI